MTQPFLEPLAPGTGEERRGEDRKRDARSARAPDFSDSLLVLQVQNGCIIKTQDS